MKNLKLFPHKFKKIGWLLLLPNLVIGILAYVYDWQPHWLEVETFGIVSGTLLSSNEYFTFTTKNILYEIVVFFGVIGAVLVGFSKVKEEDEISMSIRLNSLAMATYINYAMIILAFLLIHGMVFINVMIFSMFALLLLFIVIFHIQYHRFKNTFAHEK